ncbi:MAG TPA: lamin tail domain-containing protein [Pyrinomonadaceae bacterium]|nr:lamin tail domain-containing protein [Pyrinomonadaceae bacterium]
MNTKSVFRWLRAILCLALTFSNGPSARAQVGQCPFTQVTSIQGSIASNDPVQIGRLHRNGIPSHWEVAKQFPGLHKTSSGVLDNSPRRYDSYSYTNTSGAVAHIRVTLVGHCSDQDNEIQSAVYLNSFNPQDIGANYLADGGQSPTVSPVVYSFSVPAGATYIVVVNESGSAGCGGYTLTLDCAPPLLSVGNVLISEFRLAGPGQDSTSRVRDEFIELYNNTDAPIDLSGYNLGGFDPALNGPAGGLDFVQPLPGGSIIPPRGHLLIGDSVGYTLGAYAVLDFDTAPVYNDDFFIHDQGIRLTSPGGTVVYDSVGFIGGGGPGAAIDYVEGTGLPRVSIPPVQWSWVRKMMSGRPQDTNNNAADFMLVAADGNNTLLTAVLGAPGPENILAPRASSEINPSPLDSKVSNSSAPNLVRVFCASAGPALGTPPCDANTSPLGFLSIRRKFTNNTGEDVTRLRFRVVDITTLGTPFETALQSDLRAVSSSAFTMGSGSNSVSVKGTTLEEPPAQALGGGINSSLSVGTITLDAPLPAGGTVNVQLLLGVWSTGSFRFFINIEGLQSSPTSLKASSLSTTSVATKTSSDGPAAKRTKRERQKATVLTNQTDVTCQNGQQIASGGVVKKSVQCSSR